MPTSRIAAIADSLDPKIRSAFLKAVRDMQAGANMTALLKAVESGNAEAINKALRMATWTKALQPAADVLRTVFDKAGISEARYMSGQLGIAFRFDIENPLAARSATFHAARFVRETSAETRNAIASVIRRGLVEHIPPKRLIQDIRPLIGLNSRYVKAVENARAGWKSAGLSDELVAKKSAAYARRLLTDRADNIARTESIRAANDGQLAAWFSAEEDGLIDAVRTQRKWVAARSERTCPICSNMNGKKVPFNKPFVSEISGAVVMGAPIHPRCRCSVVLETIAVPNHPNGPPLTRAQKALQNPLGRALSYKGDTYLMNREDAEDLAKVTGGRVVKTKIFFTVTNFAGQPYGPGGFSTEG